MKIIPIFLGLLSFLGAMEPRAEALSIVAAENFYGGVAAQVAGPSAQVSSLMSNPNQDPHEFQTDVSTAKAVADADIVIYSGIGYDTWMEKLLASQSKPGRVVIKVSELIGARDGDNPHIWYAPKTMPALVRKLAEILHKPEAVAAFSQSMQPLLATIAELRTKAEGMKVTATEPVFGSMASALGFRMLNDDFQVAVMSVTEPSFQQTAAFEKSLTDGTAKILFYNSQVSDPSTKRMQEIAKSHGVPVVGVTETQPADAKSYVDWMLVQLAAVQSALK